MNTTRLDEAFVTGALLPSVAEVPSFVDFVQVLAAKLGCGAPPSSPNQKAVADFVGEAEHIVFVLVDGMGWMLLDGLPAGAFLRTQRKMELRSIFPSTTGCAIPSLATACWPCRHGAPGWWAYLEDRDLSIITLPFLERMGQKSLTHYGVEVPEVWPLPPWLQGFHGSALSIQPARFIDSPFSQYHRGYTCGQGYRTIAEAVDDVLTHASDVTGRGYTYLYLPHFDAACHEFGVDSEQARQALQVINGELTRLAASLRGRARLVIGADHGHLDVPESGHHFLLANDPLLALLKAPPAGEPRTPIFHVRAGQAEKFAEMFNRRFGAVFALLSSAELAASKLLGPEPLAPLATRRFGDFIGIPLQLVSLEYQTTLQPSKPDHIGQHAGLTPQEMRFPLIVV